MASTKVNVLVYAGNGSTVESVRHCLFTLRRLLSSNYAVITVTGDSIIKEPWTASCALLVIPGGADLGYCRTLNGEGNRRIRQFVQRGGSYIGLCAGGYYGSQRCEFEVGNKVLEVVGSRELQFFPGICRGCAFAGFVYHSEAGARAAELRVSKSSLTAGKIPEQFRSYYNGGGVFVDAAKYQEKGVEVLASYAEDLSVDGGDGNAAIVYCKIGEGGAILMGPHPEFAAANLDRKQGGETYGKVIDALAEDDAQRVNFLKACLLKLGLKVSDDRQAVPSLSRLHLSGAQRNDVTGLLGQLKSVIVSENNEDYIKGENDTFIFEKPSRWSMGDLGDSLPESRDGSTEADGNTEDKIVDYDAVIKRIVPHEKDYPACKDTPYFNHHAFFSNLKLYQSSSKDGQGKFGKHLLYGEVVTSTNTMLEKNTSLLNRLPTGFTATATVQVAGRGRGSNVWVSPAGSLMFSTCIRHPIESITSAPVVFVQYLAAMAIVEGIKSYDKGYKDLPIKLKWPNDIYALDPAQPGKKKYIKIGGILVNSSYSGKEYLLVVGVGLNTTNALPTTSLNALLPKHLSPFTLEKLLARILSSFEGLYARFLRTGFDDQFEKLYYSYWLHSDQIVTLETEGGVRARIKGITKDWGLLRAEQLGWEDRPTGKIWELQSDANSFDFLKGLVRKKV